MYHGSITHTQSLELSNTIMVSRYKAEYDNSYLKYLTQHDYRLSQYQCYRKCFTRLHQEDNAFVNEETLMVSSKILDKECIWFLMNIMGFNESN